MTAEASPAASGAPAAAESPAAKSRSHRKKATEAMTAEASPAASGAPAAAESPAAKSRSHRKKATAVAEPAMTPAVTPVAPAPGATATPKPNMLGRFFNKPTATPVPAAATTPMPDGNATEVVANAAPVPGGGDGMVWVNTESHVFHREGSRYYGKTKQGKYMTEEEAVKMGNRPPKRGQ